MIFYVSSLIPTKKVLKVAFFIFQQQNSHGFISWLFFSWEGKNDTFETFSMGKHGWSIKGQMLRKLMLYPRKNFRFIRACPCDPKQINANISKVPHRKFIFFFQWLAYIKYEWFLQELEMACVFAIKISIYIVCSGSYPNYFITTVENE